MSDPPYRMIQIDRELSGVRDAVTDVVGPGEKMRLSRFAELSADAAERLMLAWADSVEPLASDWLGEPAALVLMIGTVRHHTTQIAERAPWHTDSVFFRPFGGRGVTAWLTFDDAGKSAPGIEFQVADSRSVPLVPAGSALVFGSAIPHRTQLVAGDRVSVEFRCVPAMTVRDGHSLNAAAAMVEGRKLVIRLRGAAVWSGSIR